MFNQLQKNLALKFHSFKNEKIFIVDFDKDLIYEKYLEGFSTPELKQGHACNCCKSFLRACGGMVIIKNNKIVSIWDDLEAPEEYVKSIQLLRDYIHSLKIKNRFLTTESSIGTKQNYDNKRDLVWEHFYLTMPNQVIQNNLGPKLSNSLADKEVLERSLKELTIDATETILELISQNSLYRGQEHKNTLENFLKLQKSYKKTKSLLKDNFCWLYSTKAPGNVVRIINTSIGTFLSDLSKGMELDKALTRFEKLVAPSNYKRPKAIVTPKMVEKAKEKLNSLGLLESIRRRYAKPTDLNINHILYTDKSSEIKDVFDEIKQESSVNPKTLSKVDEISINEFISNVLPNVDSLEVLVENEHKNNFVSLLTSEDNKTPTLFKWDNHFSWAYTGDITDSIKEKVKKAGGNVQGVLRASLSWSNTDDLDIHCIEPDQNKIYFGNKQSSSSGFLDIDMNAGYAQSTSPVENIAWTSKNSMKEGLYTIQIHNYNKRGSKDEGYTVELECDNEIFTFSESTNPRDSSYGLKIQFNWSKEKGIELLQNKQSRVLTSEKWGVKSNSFVKVKNVLLSPNYWDTKVGNKHYLFILDHCVSDEKPRPFFNEFLKQELNENRKVFEILGEKLKIEESEEQLSGLGFSETQKNHIIVKAKGKFTRLLKVKF